ncbi:MAG: hypothetical protein E6940_10665 [Clostridium septicum]|uniref:ImmA/IrrE family metallo-endopeptidase n=1 Tax=Clostridium septicum TaxID=1504 RepID=UPI0025831C6A|nr:ImmA/IrrE family metallo-endopeptidase [Clostridium septicum]MDU1314506.1 hypothetical protein [Clostridium septicum]
MNKYENLLDEVNMHGVEVVELDLGTDTPCGKCINNLIILNSRMTTKNKYCILSEELGHHFTSYGDILDQSDIKNRKQEIIARRWGYKKLVGIVDLINAYNAGVKNRYELAEFLNVTESFIDETIEYYRAKYGTCYKIDNYIIYFQPNFGILKML